MIRFWEARMAEPLALATLVSVQGSSFRRAGARMLIDKDGNFTGGVSAGCIEEEVIVCARQVLRSGEPQLLSFDTRRRFGCHGAIEILVEVVAKGLLQELREHAVQRQSCRLETVYHGRARGTRMATYEVTEGAFVQTVEPALRLILIGDGCETRALRAHAVLLGWEVLPMETAPEAAEVMDDKTAVVLATHHYGRDCAALRDLLPLDLKYLGMVGSRRRREDLLFDVMQNGVPFNASLFAPAGLHLGADTPEEIALSIIAEIQCVFAAGSAQPLRNHQAPIHSQAPELLSCNALV